MDILKEVNTYTLDIYSGGSNEKEYAYRAMIGLYESDGEVIGGLYFHRDASSLPGSDLQDPSGYVWCHFLWSDYLSIIDMLRNESPVFLRYVDSGAVASLTTSPESIGDNE